MKDFLDKECVYTEVTEPKEVWPIIARPPIKMKYAGFYLKRFKGENEETVLKPHTCRFVTSANRCSIYEDRPVVCRKFPYTTYYESGLFHAYYVDVPFSNCQGYRPKPHLKKQWLAGWVKDLMEGDKEIAESVQSGFFIVTEIKQDE